MLEVGDGTCESSRRANRRNKCQRVKAVEHWLYEGRRQRYEGRMECRFDASNLAGPCIFSLMGFVQVDCKAWDWGHLIYSTMKGTTQRSLEYFLLKERNTRKHHSPMRAGLRKRRGGGLSR